MRVLDLFSAAAGGWSLGMHRAGFTTVAACEVIEWRRILYAENNPGVRLYDDVRGLTADQLVRDLGHLPECIVGSPPCQDISSANTKGKGVEGERSGLYFEAIRLVGECRPRWFAFENSANLRTRGADAVLAAVEALGYACWPLVVRAGHGRGGAGVGANHERPRSWLVGCDVEQLVDAPGVGHGGGRAWGHGPEGHREASTPAGDARYAHGDGRAEERSRRGADVPHADREGQPDGTLDAEVGRSEGVGGPVAEPWADWNGGLASHLLLDARLSAWVAQSRIAVGGPKGTAAASLLVEAFGDAVLPQIPEAIGRAILRTERALAAVHVREAA